MQEFSNSQAVRKSENASEQLQADAKQKHPDMPLSEAIQQERIERSTEKLASETDEVKRKTLAADMFLGFFFVNARTRPEFCSEQGVNIQPFVNAFEDAHANEIAKARSIKARASVDEKKLYTLIQPQLRKTIVQNMNDIATSEKISLKEVCQRFSENADAIVQEMQLAKVHPVLFKALTSAK